MKQIIRISVLFVFMVASYYVKAQTSDFDKDLEKYLQISGVASNYDLVYDQVKPQLKMMKQGVPDSVWVNLKKEVFDVEVKEITKQMVPLYKKHFTAEDVKELISFYESPIGKKLTMKTPILAREAMQLSKSWGMNLMSKFNGWLSEKGY